MRPIREERENGNGKGSKAAPHAPAAAWALPLAVANGRRSRHVTPRPQRAANSACATARPSPRAPPQPLSPAPVLRWPMGARGGSGGARAQYKSGAVGEEGVHTPRCFLALISASQRFGMADLSADRALLPWRGNGNAHLQGFVTTAPLTTPHQQPVVGVSKCSRGRDTHSPSLKC